MTITYFQVDKKLNEIMNKMDLSDNGTKLYGHFLTFEIKETKQFKRVMRSILNLDYVYLVVLDNWYIAKDKNIRQYSNGNNILWLEELNKIAKEIK